MNQVLATFKQFDNLNACQWSYRGADKSLARPGRNKLQRQNSNFCKPLKKRKNSEGCPSNQVSAAATTSASDEKWRPFNCFFQSGRAKDLSGPLYSPYGASVTLCQNHSLKFQATIDTSVSRTH